MSKLSRNIRRRYVVYEKDYVPGMNYDTATSWYQAHKLNRKFGGQCTLWVQELTWDDKVIHFWDMVEEYEYKV